MCIFSQPVISVNNTRIFARLSATGTQFLVYQMNYETPDPNAMILPMPVRRPAREDSLKFIDLDKYSEFFDDLGNGFPYRRPFGIGCSGSEDPASRDDLEVFEVGNYIASFVPRLRDFSRLSDRFTLPKSTWSKLPQYGNYGFAVFQLAAGSLQPHPMAFEFQRASDSIFFPTIHIHDGEIHDAEQFDHVLYLQHAGFDSQVYAYDNSYTVDKSTGLIRSKYVAERFCDLVRSHGIVDGNLLVHRQILRGKKPNRDTIIATTGHPTRPTLNLRPWLSYSPWLLVGGAIAWFLARRARIKRTKDADASSESRSDDLDKTIG
ncbi:MAG: hypothetical protein MUE50_03560 [Pirellulaceae bacterium]|jgi:hypothetical protein|nr:hypothetical protein [Pirellulaceae bacterium]